MGNNRSLTKESLLEFENTLRGVRDFLKNLPKEIEYLEKEIKSYDDERQDIFHYAELAKFNASEGFKIAKDLQVVAQKRRQAKDTYEVMTAAWGKINGKINNLHIIDQAIGDVRKVIDRKSNRHYNPRVRVDLKDKINRKELK